MHKQLISQYRSWLLLPTSLLFSMLLIIWPTLSIAKWYGLVIGIDQYKYGNHQQDPHPLRGAVNDAKLVRDALRDLGVIVPDNQVLLNAQATREGFIQAWQNLQQQIGPEDTLLLSFSGHGSQEPDQGVLDEQDHLDETLWFYDFNPDQPLLGRISDDELSGLLQASKAKRILLVIDSCHAGGMSRCMVAANCPSYRGGQRYQIPDNALPPPTTLPTLADQDRPMERVTHILAADKEQLKIREIKMPNGAYHGALSWYWVKALRGAADMDRDGIISRHELGQFLERKVPARIATQHPKIEPKADSEILAPSAPIIRILWQQDAKLLPTLPAVKVVTEAPADLYLTQTNGKYQLSAGNKILAQLDTLAALAPVIQRFRLLRYLWQHSKTLGRLNLQLEQGPGPHSPQQALQFIAANGTSNYRALYLFNITEDGHMQRFFPMQKYNDPTQIDRYPYRFPTIWPGKPFGHDLAVAFGCQQPSPMLDKMLQQHATDTNLPTITEFYDILEQTPCQIGWYSWQTTATTR